MRILAAAAAVLAALGLGGCGRVTAENYGKLGVGMTFGEVAGVLGSPRGCGEKLGVKSCVWGDEAANIRVSFVADKVVLYTSRNLR